MDISDGFVGDLQKLAAASNVDFEIGVDAVPFSPQVRLLIDAPENLETALTGGDDYQLLFTVPESRVASFRQKAQKAAVAVTELAVATESSGPKGSGNVTILDREGQRMRFGRASWRHF